MNYPFPLAKNGDPLTDRLLMVSALARALFHHLAEAAAQRGVRLEHHRQAFYAYDTAERRELLDHDLLRLLDERGLYEMADSRDFARIVIDRAAEPKRSGQHKLPKLPNRTRASEKATISAALDQWYMARGLGSTLGNHR